MKRNLFGIVLLMFAMSSLAQNGVKKWIVTPSNKAEGTVEYGGFLEFKIYFKNISNTYINFSWTSVAPHTLDIGNAEYSICDYGQCYNGIPTDTNKMDTLPAGVQAFMNLNYMADSLKVNGNGQVSFIVWDRDEPDFRDTVTFIVNVTPMGISASQIEKTISYYPNPATSVLNIKMEKRGYLKNIGLYNILGTQVMNFSLKQEEMNAFDISALTSGIYFIAYGEGDNKEIQKLIVE